MVTHTGHRVSDTSICPDDTPEGWLLPQFRDVVTINYGKGLTESNRVPGAIPVYGSNGLVGHHDKALTQGPCIIVGRKGTVGAVHLSKGPCWPIDTTYFIDDFSGLLPEYVFYALGQSGLGQLDTSTAIPGLNRDDVYRLQFPLPPVAEQKRIVAKVEELLARVEVGQDRLDRVPKIMKRFRQAVLAAACSGRLTEGWREKHASAELWQDLTLADVVREKPKNGYSAKPVRYETPYRVLTLTATTSGKFGPRHFKYFDEPIPEGSPLWLEPDDILVQRGNTIEYVGVPAIYDGPPHQFVYPDLMIRLRANERIDTRFLYFVLSWEQNREYLRKGAIGTAGSMPKINQPLLLTVPIPLPSPAEQQEIVRRVQALFKLADAIEKRVAAARLRADKLTQSVLAKAFRGELVPTEAELARREGRSYEPASVLLERIRAEREKGKPQAKKRRTRG